MLVRTYVYNKGDNEKGGSWRIKFKFVGKFLLFKSRTIAAAFQGFHVTYKKHYPNKIEIQSKGQLM